MKNITNMSGREYQNFLPVYLSSLNMKNSFKPEEENNKEKVDGKVSDVELISIHCIIQTVFCIKDVKSGECQLCKEKKAEAEGRDWWDCECNNVEMSGCVVIPEDTSINDVVRTVLIKLGYPGDLTSYASGFILIRNWKPLPLKSICPGMNRTVGDIFGELTATVSLKIQIFRPKTTILEKLKDNLLHYLVRANQSFLTESGCPYDMGTLLKFCDSSSRVRKQIFHEAAEKVKEKFEAWLKQIQETGKEPAKPKIQHYSTAPMTNSNFSDKIEIKNGIGGGNLNIEMDGSSRSKGNPAKSEGFENYKKDTGKDKSIGYYKETSNLIGVVERQKHSMLPKTRIRTSFDPELELPKLHNWYLKNPHPNRQQIYEYVTELNSLESRKGRKQLDVNNVLYWFKNARAAQKRTECRKISNATSTNMTAHRGSVLKIPLGKTSGVSSDDQKSLSDDDASVTSEPAEDYRYRGDRCLQVVGKWNSNGQGEAVLEMQIGSSPKNDFVQSSASTKKEQKKENGVEECSRSANLSTDEDSIDPVRRLSPPEKKESFEENMMENDRKDANEFNLTDKSRSEIRNVGKSKVARNKLAGADNKKTEVSVSKTQLRNKFQLYKDSEIVKEPGFLPSYNSGISNIFEHSLMCMSQYISSKPTNLPLTADERRKRNRTFIDPVTEVPRLEEWFRLSTHPSHNLIARYTDELNGMPYRRKFPKLETKNVQFWFKNRRAKNKRLNYLEINK